MKSPTATAINRFARLRFRAHPRARFRAHFRAHLRVHRVAQWLAIASIAALSFQSLPLQARSSDFEQAIDVNADRSEYDEKAGLQRLIGNVRITQGSMRILAQSITVKLKDNKLSVIEGEGSPIEFTQENDQGELVSGQCNRIIYNAVNGQLTLQGKASLTEPRQSLRSDKIVFDSKTQTVVAEGGDSGQVSITLQPPEQKE